ncbi:MAG: hypothetical protein WA821_11050 [Anaerolineales bacterium]
MDGSMDMLKVIEVKTPEGPVPDGLKVASITGPNSLQPLPACPVLAVGSFTLWPMSYIDNRVSFGMVMYDPKGQVAHLVEKPGARYIYKITLEGSGSSGSATFWGQADQKVTLSLDEICQMLCYS